MPPRIPYPLVLSTERLLIRSPTYADAPALREAILDSLDALRPWMPWAQRPPTLDEMEDSCAQAVAAFEAGTDHRLYLFLKGSPTFIGGSGLHGIDWDVPCAEIGYWVRTPYSGHGYITEAVRELTRYALDDLGMHRVEIRMSTRNTKSRAVPERLGYTLEGILRHHQRHLDGSLRDTCVYARTSA